MLDWLSSYRSSDEVKSVRKEKDAIKLVEAYALEGQLATADELKVTAQHQPYTDWTVLIDILVSRS